MGITTFWKYDLPCYRTSIKGRPLIEVRVSLYRVGIEYLHAYLKNPWENGARMEYFPPVQVFLKRPSIKGRPLIEVRVNLYRVGT